MDPVLTPELYDGLLALAREQLRMRKVSLDLAGDIVHEAYLACRLLPDRESTPEIAAGWLRYRVVRLVENIARRRPSVHGLWESERGLSLEALAERGIEVVVEPGGRV